MGVQPLQAIAARFCDEQTVWTVDNRPSGRYFAAMVKTHSEDPRHQLLNAAESVIARQGIGNLTLDAVASEAGVSKGGLLHHFPSKDRLVEALVQRTADGWRACHMEAYERSPEGPGRMTRAMLDHCLSDAKSWRKELKQGTAACFAALAQNPALIKPMRETYAELTDLVARDGLPPGVGEAIVAAIDGLWLYWVLDFADVNQELVVRVREALENMLNQSLAAQDETSPARKQEGETGS